MIHKAMLASFLIVMTAPAWAHDPIFGIGPHVLFKDGVEISVETHAKKNGNNREIEPALELAYGITGDWSAGVEIPYLFQQEDRDTSDGLSDVSVFTQYRFWREDSLGLQKSAAVLLKIKTSTGDNSKTSALGTGTTDSIFGLSYGYEGRTWYRWASVRYRNNGTNSFGYHQGNNILVDFAGGIRPVLSPYTEPDTVWLLELNGEFSEPATLKHSAVENTGGSQWFLSPGIFWSKRNFAIKSGVQIPIFNLLKGEQEQDDFRVKFGLEWHL